MQFSGVLYYELETLFYLRIKRNLLQMPFKWPLKFHVKSGSGYQISKNMSLENGLIKLHGVLSNI